MKIYVLASGSKGNMTYIKTETRNIFIDAGISLSKIKEKMLMYQLTLEEVDTLLITHEHQDHIMGLKMLLKQKIIKHIYLTQGTFDAIKDDVKILFPQHTTIIKADVAFNINGLNVMPFMVSHDAKEPVGFVMKAQEKKLVLLTDTGYVDQSYMELLKDADVYILEANHHPTKLMNSLRPFYLKKRILSEKGHLSNEDACWLMNQLIQTKKSVWVVAHMSDDCNDILDIEQAIVDIFDDPTKVITYYASQVNLPVIEL